MIIINVDIFVEFFKTIQTFGICKITTIIKLILLFSKDILTRSKATVKTSYKIYFYIHQKNPAKNVS